jgi:hypothetical protein
MPRLKRCPLLSRPPVAIRRATGGLLCLVLLVSSGAPAQEMPPQTPPEPGRAGHASVALVGTKRIFFHQVLEEWRPVWRATLARLDRGETGRDLAEARLQEAWLAALDAAVREEVFHQEAERTLEMRLSTYAERLYEARNDGRAHRESPGFQRLLSATRRQYQENLQRLVNENARLQADRLGGEEALFEVLARQGVDYETFKESLRRKIVVQRYLADAIPLNNIAEPRPSDIRAYYRTHREDFLTPGKVVFRHIFVTFERDGGEAAARERAAEIHSYIKEEALSFAEAARRYSDDRISAEAGGLEPLPEEAIPPGGLPDDPEREAWMQELRSAVEEIEDPGLGPLLIGTHGCHIARILRRDPGHVVPFSEAQKRIEQALLAEKRERLTERLYRRLREQVRVEILMPEFPETYLSARAIDRALGRTPEAPPPPDLPAPDL